jgi:hypothetical protein
MDLPSASMTPAVPVVAGGSDEPIRRAEAAADEALRRLLTRTPDESNVLRSVSAVLATAAEQARSAGLATAAEPLVDAIGHLVAGRVSAARIAVTDARSLLAATQTDPLRQGASPAG